MSNPQAKWQKWLPWAVLIIMVAWALSGLRTARNRTDYAVEEFSKIPVLLNGRIQPFDSVAKNVLLMLRGKASVLITDRPQEQLGFMEKAKLKKLTATEWLLEVMTRPELADTRHVFRVDNGEVLGLLKLSPERKYFTFAELKEGWDEVEQQAGRIRDQKIEEAAQTPFEKQIIKLQFSLGLYFRVKNSLRPMNTARFGEELQVFQSSIGPGLAALQKRQADQEHEDEDVQTIGHFFNRYRMLSRAAYPLIIPPADAEKSQENWMNIGTSLMESLREGQIHPAVLLYAKMADGYGQENAATFNAAVTEYLAWLSPKFAPELKKGAQENFFNHYAPFIKSISLYLLAFLFGCVFWIKWAPWARTSAMYLLLLAAFVHTSGLIFRMYLEGRPPVTNLYSSAIFVGWGAVILGIILERVWKDGIGAVTASAVGVATLIIAHNLSLSGDTMEMLRAVLDTNFWLATHVVVITLGYSAMFVAGFLATVFIVRGFFTKSLPSTAAKALNRMVYGIICFATLFSFVGTILGGIWADQSWGRFWGWDPKENGALLIVIWCAIVLHARLGGLIRDRGLMAMAIFGNIVTAFSWFGVNMLGVGLHSYGFMDAAFKWLMIFNVSQLMLIALALMPLAYWKSFRDTAAAKVSTGPGLAGAKPAAA